MKDFTLYYSAVRADDAYHNALVHLYGAQACNARYDSRGSVAELKPLRDAKLAADAAWSEAMRIND